VRRWLWLAAAALSVPAGAQQLKEVPPRFGHLVYLPKKMWATKKRWPLILYLHGKSLRGNDLKRVSAYGLPRRLRTDKGFPFIVVCPQLPGDQRWTDTRAMASLVQDIAKRYPVDRSRVYAMGFSMGASGAWRVAHAYPRLFAALVSVGGTYEIPLAASGRLKPVPVWMIHGTEDREASPAVARQTLEMHMKKGGRGRFTALPGKGHNITDVFERSEVYRWLLQNRAGMAPRTSILTNAPPVRRG